MRDNDANILESNINANDQPMKPFLESDPKLENTLDDTITASKKRGSKILELKKVQRMTKIKVVENIMYTTGFDY